MARLALEMGALNDVAAICLDLDDTLWPIGPVIARAETTLFEWLAGRYPRVTERHDIASMRRLRERVAEDHPHMRHDLAFLRREALVRHAVEAGYPESLADEGFDRFFTVRNEVEPFADVVPALDALRRGYRLMSLSNGNADLQRIGLAGYFEHARARRAPPSRMRRSSSCCWHARDWSRDRSSTLAMIPGPTSRVRATRGCTPCGWTASDSSGRMNCHRRRIASATSPSWWSCWRGRSLRRAGYLSLDLFFCSIHFDSARRSFFFFHCFLTSMPLS
jgi:hypothetical protein